MVYIWDLDGTLIDSYDGILDSIMDVLKYFHLEMKREDVYKFIIEKSVHEFLDEISITYKIDLPKVIGKYQEYRINTQMNVTLMDNAYETLEYLYLEGHSNFIYTHKGDSTHTILKNLGIDKFFKEVLTSENHFKRKPDPEAIDYLIDKYNLNKEEVYYIGDRPLDILCAKNANIKGIFLKNALMNLDVDADRIIYNLIELTK